MYAIVVTACSGQLSTSELRRSMPSLVYNSFHFGSMARLAKVSNDFESLFWTAVMCLIADQAKQHPRDIISFQSDLPQHISWRVIHQSQSSASLLLAAGLTRQHGEFEREQPTPATDDHLPYCIMAGAQEVSNCSCSHLVAVAWR